MDSESPCSKVLASSPCVQTPGISKTLLTPCRRMGLKRKSPGSSESPCIKNQKNEFELNCDVSNHSPVSSSSLGETPKRFARIPITSRLEAKTAVSPAVTRASTEKEIVDRVTNVELIEAVLDKKEDSPSTSNEFDTEDVTPEMLLVLQNRIAEKEEKLRSLRRAQLYKKKHDINKLNATISRWRAGCQSALCDLLSTSQSRGFKITMVQLLSQLGIPSMLVGYDTEQEDFI